MTGPCGALKFKKRKERGVGAYQREDANAYETMTMKIKSNRSLFLRILSVVCVLCICFSFSGCRDLSNMTEEERIAYEQQQEEEARLKAELKTEKKNGFKLFTSSNLTPSETAVTTLIEAMRNKDVALMSALMGVPNAFNDSNLSEWMEVNGFYRFVALEPQQIGILTKTEDVGIGYYIFPIDKTDPIRFTVEKTGENNYVVTPPTGIATNYILLLPSKTAFCNTTDISKSMIWNGSSPLSGKDTSTWYRYEFDRFIDTAQPQITLRTAIGEFDAICEKRKIGYNEEGVIGYAEFDAAKQEEFNTIAEETAMRVFDLLQARASDSELATVLTSASVIATCSPSNERVWEKVSAGIDSVYDIEVIIDPDISNDVPANYNYHIYNDDGIEMKCRFKLLTREGECRRKTSMILRKIDGNWKIISLDIGSKNNMFADISPYDPQW